MEWVEVRGPTVDVAIEAALQELGLETRDAADVEVLREPERGFLGIGRTDAVVRVKPKPTRKRRRRKTGKVAGESKKPRQEDRGARQRSAKPASEAKRGEGKRKGGPDRGKPREEGPAESKRETTVSREAQATVVREFLEGLLDAFGLEGDVQTRVEDEIIYANVLGNQTEALVGSRGVILQSIHELCRTVVQRQTQEAARLRLDIAGYAERRREALKIYAQRLAGQVLEDGGEIMLEPMNSAERKVIHDTIAEIEGVRTYSEGEEPRRSVVIAPEKQAEDQGD